MRPQLSLLAAFALTLVLHINVCAAVSPDKLEEAIAREKIFAADTKLRVSVEGREATVSTFKIDTATTDDCKIDAVLVGKVIFAEEPSISHVSLHIHDPRVPRDYSEVRVTVGDVRAFAAGTTSKAELLSSLELLKHSELVATTTASASPAATANPSSAIVAEENANKMSIASSTVPLAGKATYNNYGLALNYPNAWKVEYPQSGNTLVRFYLHGQSKQPSIVDLKLYNVPMGNYHGQHHHERSWRHSGVAVAGVQIPASLKVGKSKNLGGAQRAYWASAPMSPKEYMRTVSFCSGKYVFQLLLLCAEKDAIEANSEFERLLSDLTVSGAQPGSSPRVSLPIKQASTSSRRS